MTNRVVLDAAAKRALAALDADDRRAAIVSLRELATNPEPQHGAIGRLHIGWLRIVYEVADELNEIGTKTITVWHIGVVA